VAAEKLAQTAREDLVTEPQPVLYVVATGASPASQLGAFVRFAQQLDWDVCVIATPEGARFFDTGQLAELTGHPVRVHYKDPSEPDVLPPADAFVIAPATFNTINKLALGLSDTLALGLLNEAVGLDLPIIAVPWPNAPLARHPAFQRAVADIRSWGIKVIFDPMRLPGASGGDPGSSAGDPGADGAPAEFPWAQLHAELATVRAAVDERGAG
jgi:hypothetical protein